MPCIVELLIFPLFIVFLLAGNIECLLQLTLSCIRSTALSSLSITLAAQAPVIMTFARHLLTELRMFGLNEEKLEIDYIISTLMKKKDLDFDNENLYWTLELEMPGIYLYITEFNSKYQSSLPFMTATLTRNWLNQLNLLVATASSYTDLPIESSSHSFEKEEDFCLADNFPFCKENCSSSSEFHRLQESHKQLENLEFQFLSLMTTDISDGCLRKLEKLSLKTEHLQDELSTVGTGLCCCLDPIRSLRKWLNKRCETLLAKIQFSCNSMAVNAENMFGIYVRLPNGNHPTYKMVQPLMTIETLSRNIEDEFHITDFYLTLNGRILNNDMSIEEENISLSSIIDVQLRLRGGIGLCCIVGCNNETGDYLLTRCKGSYEIKEHSVHICHEHLKWDRENHVDCGQGKIGYILCSSCKKEIKCFRPYGCSKHMSNFLRSTFHVTCAETVSSHNYSPSCELERNFICFSCSEGLKQLSGQQVMSSFQPANPKDSRSFPVYLQIPSILATYTLY